MEWVGFKKRKEEKEKFFHGVWEFSRMRASESACALNGKATVRVRALKACGDWGMREKRMGAEGRKEKMFLSLSLVTNCVSFLLRMYALFLLLHA